MKSKFMIIAVAALAVVALPMMSANQAYACGGAKSACTSKTAATTASADNGTKADVTPAVATEKVDAKSAHSCTGVCPHAMKAEASATGSCTGKMAEAGQCSKTCSKETGVAWLMANKGMSKEEAEKAFSECSMARAAVTAAVAEANQTCSKDQCVAWLMSNKGMTKDQALAAYQHCAESKAMAQHGVMIASTKTDEAATLMSSEEPNK